MGVKDDVDLRAGVRSRVSGLRWRVVKLTRTGPKVEVALDGKVLARGLPTDVFDARMKGGVSPSLVCTPAPGGGVGMFGPGPGPTGEGAVAHAAMRAARLNAAPIFK